NHLCRTPRRTSRKSRPTAGGLRPAGLVVGKGGSNAPRPAAPTFWHSAAETRRGLEGNNLPPRLQQTSPPQRTSATVHPGGGAAPPPGTARPRSCKGLPPRPGQPGRPGFGLPWLVPRPAAPVDRAGGTEPPWLASRPVLVSSG